VPIVLNLGYKATNASVYGLAGNAPAYKGRLFGAAAFVFTGPAKSTIIFGSEFSQEPRTVQNLPGADVPTTITYAARIVPLAERKFNIDFGVAQAAGTIEPGVNLKARHQFALGVFVRTIDRNIGENSTWQTHHSNADSARLLCMPARNPTPRRRHGQSPYTLRPVTFSKTPIRRRISSGCASSATSTRA
jgi:hypothetical protein